MKLVVLPRKAGKTNKLIEWLEQGQEKESYPFWDRVVITTTTQEADFIRGFLKRKHPNKDTYRWIFSYEEWCRAYVPYSHLISVAIDNADEFLQYLFRGNGQIKLISINQEG